MTLPEIDFQDYERRDNGLFMPTPERFKKTQLIIHPGEIAHLDYRSLREFLDQSEDPDNFKGLRIRSKTETKIPFASEFIIQTDSDIIHFMRLADVENWNFFKGRPVNIHYLPEGETLGKTYGLTLR
jgi:hypothetical protein